jgi:hypothetical protein
MPTYSVKVGEKTHKIESEQSLSDADISEYVDSLPAGGEPAPKLGPRRATPGSTEAPAKLPQTAGEYATAIKRGLLGVGDTALTMAGGMARDVAGSYAGLYKGITQGRDAAGMARAKEAWTSGGGASTPEGEKGVQAVAFPMQEAQKVSGAAGEAAGGLIGEPQKGRVLGELLPEAAAYAGGLKQLSMAKGAMKAGAPLSQAREEISAAQRNGFRADPAEANPTLKNQMLEGMADRRRVQDKIATHNQEVAADHIRTDLGLPKDARIDLPTLEGIRLKAGKPYEDIKNLKMDISVNDPTYQAAIANLDKGFESMKEFTPELYNQPKLERARGALAQSASPGHPEAFTPKAILEISQRLREKASFVLKQERPDHDVFLEAKALKEGATAMEDLLERHLTAAGSPRMVKEFRDARELIAKTYDVEAATNLTSGAIDPQVLRRMSEKGQKLSGGLEKIAHAASAMPNVMKSVEHLDTSYGPHIGDWGAAALAGGAAAMGHPALLAGALARPAARAAASSGAYQALAGQVKPNKPRQQYKMKEVARGLGAVQQATQQDETPNN